MTKLYKYTEGAHDLSNLPPQAAAIVEEVRKEGVVRRGDLLNSLGERFRGNYMQDPKNILAFYRGRLINEGFLMEITV